jgi:phage/plasmid-like protein (TIGR03299 family)
MSHEFESGVFSDNKEAWHSLGAVLPEKLRDIPTALTLGGLDWTVSKRPLAYTDEVDPDVVIPVDNYFALVRDTDNTVLNPCVSSSYHPLQNAEAFQFFEPFLHEGCFISSAISLNAGKKICLLAEIEDNEREVVTNDPVKAYLLLATSHDGSIGTTVKFTNVRVVCSNTLRAAMAERGEFRTIRHTASQMQQLSEVRASINLFKRSFEQEVSIYKELANRTMGLNATRSYLERLFEKQLIDTAKRLDILPEDVSLEQNRFTKKCLENYMFSEDLQLDGVEGTAWAAFNAVTEAIKDRSSNRDNRYNSIWFGPDSKLLDEAKQLALTL